MALHATAVQILIEKSRFEPEVALGIAEAIEASMMHAQFVTVPILDARLHELRAEMRIALMSLENKFDLRFGELDAKIHQLDSKLDGKLGEQDVKLDGKFGQQDAKLERKFGELATLIERNKAELIRWVFLVMLGNVALGAGAAAVLNALKHIG